MQTKRYLKQKLSYGEFPNPVKQWALLGFTKVLYLAIWIVIPLLFFNMPWWQILIGFFIMHYVAGLILRDRKSTRLNSSHVRISYAVFCLKKKKKNNMIYNAVVLTCFKYHKNQYRLIFCRQTPHHQWIGS